MSFVQRKIQIIFCLFAVLFFVASYSFASVSKINCNSKLVNNDVLQQLRELRKSIYAAKDRVLALSLQKSFDDRVLDLAQALKKEPSEIIALLDMIQDTFSENSAEIVKVVSVKDKTFDSVKEKAKKILQQTDFYAEAEKAAYQWYLGLENAEKTNEKILEKLLEILFLYEMELEKVASNFIAPAKNSNDILRHLFELNAFKSKKIMETYVVLLTLGEEWARKRNHSKLIEVFSAEYPDRIKLCYTRLEDTSTTLLGTSLFNEQYELAEVLVLLGATLERNKDLRVHLGYDWVNGASALEVLIEKKLSEKILRRFIAAGLDPIAIKSYDESNILHLLKSKDYLTLAKEIIQSNPELLNTTNADGATPLMKVRDPAIVQLYIDSGAKLDVQDNNGYTALHYAKSNSDQKEKAKLLIKYGANTKIKNKDGYTPEGLRRSLSPKSSQRKK